MPRPLETTLLISSLVLAASPGAGCVDPPEPPPPSRPQPEGPPPIPEVAALTSPGPGRASVALPRWNAAASRFDHAEQEMAAGFGRAERVTQILLGEDATTGVLINFYGAELRTGRHAVSPATDETRAGAGPDANVLVLTVGQQQGQQQSHLRSREGTIHIEDVAEDHVTGTVDVTIRSQNMLRETQVRARFQAHPSQWINAELEHQAAIRDQLRNR